MVVFSIYDIKVEFDRLMKLRAHVFVGGRVSGYAGFCRHFTEIVNTT